MKVIILAAGKGERLKNIISDMPKPMVRIKNKPILEHNILWLKNYGIKDLYINIFHLSHIIKNYFKDGRKFGVQIHYSEEKKILGTAGAVKKIAQNWQENFLVIYGDNLFPASYNLSQFISFHLKNNYLASIGFYKKSGDLKQSGVAVLNNDGTIQKFIEKPLHQAPTNLVNTGIYLLNPKIINWFPNGFSDFGRDIFPLLLRKKIKLGGFIFQGQLVAIDTPKLYKKILG